MAANLRIAGPNLLDWIPTYDYPPPSVPYMAVNPPATSGFPLSNVQNVSRAKFLRISATSVSVWADIGTTFAESPGCFVVWRHNLSASATVRLRLWTPGPSGTLLYDTGSIAVWGMSGGLFDYWDYKFTPFWFPVAVGAGYFEIDFNDASNPDGYIQVNRVFLAPYLEPAVNVSEGMSFWPEDTSEQIRTAGGSLRSETRVGYRRWELALKSLSETEREVLFRRLTQAGKRRDFFISAFPEGSTLAELKQERDSSALVKLVSMPQMSYRTEASGKYETPFVFEEI